MQLCCIQTQPFLPEKLAGQPPARELAHFGKMRDDSYEQPLISIASDAIKCYNRSMPAIKMRISIGKIKAAPYVENTLCRITVERYLLAAG